MRKISVRRHNEYALQASLQGIQVPVIGQESGELKLDEKSEKAVENAREAAMARIRARYKKQGS